MNNQKSINNNGSMGMTLDVGATNDATFVVMNEDHTIGNSIRFLAMKDPRTHFCGYSIPHPSETKMNIRLQCVKEVNAADVMLSTLKNLEALCDALDEKLDSSGH